ncbi:hypothetical protein ACKGJN_11265 [Gillisia sp. Q332]|uniref:hypothetical protein n=1 Tax=Gillisia xinjiangensis TaxID=3384765 RepID=UPI00391BD498
MVKQNLEKFFELPANFITDEADLYILTILSMYFKEGQAERDGIKKFDIDVSKLYLSRKDLRMDEDGNKLNIYLKELLKEELHASVREKAHYQDDIGQDGFSGHLLESILCMMEISSIFTCGYMEFPEDDDSRMQVVDLVKFVVQGNSEIIKN